MAEFKYLAAPVFITRKGAKTSNKFEIFNKFFFKDLSGYKLRYEVTVNGEIVHRGNLNKRLLLHRLLSPHLVARVDE